MRLPRKRMTLRGMMLAIALMAVLMGLIVGSRAERLRKTYLRSASRYATLEESERDMEKFYSSQVEWHEESASRLARAAASEYRRLRAMSRMTYAIPMPGSSGGDPDALMELMRSSIEQSIGFAEQNKETAAQDRAQSALAAKRVLHFSRLRRKYERAAAHPWRRVESDPPAPE
jgi:hypothetical protein